MTQTLRSINLLNSLSVQFKADYPDQELPEEITNDPTLVDTSQKYFSEDVENLKAEEIPADTETFVVDTFDNCKWKHLRILLESTSKDIIKTLYLGHDGCIEGEKEDIEAVLTGLKNLKAVHYCGYYAGYEKELHELCEKHNIKSIPIY